jgi:hypothetical protein
MFDPFQSISGTAKQLLVARVKKVVLGAKITDSQPDPDYKSEKDLGAITYELLYSGKDNISGGTKSMKLAYPIYGFLRQYPLVGEIVLLVSGPSADLNDSSQNQDLYYFPPFSLFNSIHANAFPNMKEYSDYVRRQLVGSKNTVYDFSSFSLPMGATFVEQSDVKSLRPFEGDTILQGRWGQSIRFGSTVPGLKSISPWSVGKTGDNSQSGNPITIISNSQKKYITQTEKQSPTTVEDINRDGSSIYLTSTQNIMIDDINTFEVRSWNLNISVDPQIHTVVVPEQIPISNDSISAREQDSKSLK